MMIEMVANMDSEHADERGGVVNLTVAQVGVD